MTDEKKKLDGTAISSGDTGAIGTTTDAGTTGQTGTAGDTGAAGETTTAPAPQQPNRIDEINKLYDAQKQNQLAQLENAYNQSLSKAQAAADKIPATYQTQANDLAVQYERNRRNLNQQAAGSGINTGAGSQMALALNSQWQRDYGGVKQAQADAQAEAERGIVDLTSQYQSAISQAVSENDYKRAADLLDEYENQYKNDMNKAQILAQFGDFSGFAGLYGQEQADKMFNIWKAQNPDLAWNTGNLTAAEYQAMTGKPPINSPGGGGTIADVINGMMNGGGGNGGGGGESSGFSDYVANYMWGDAHKYNSGSGGSGGGNSTNPYGEYLANIYYGTPGTTNPHRGR